MNHSIADAERMHRNSQASTMPPRNRPLVFACQSPMLAWFARCVDTGLMVAGPFATQAAVEAWVAVANGGPAA